MSALLERWPTATCHLPAALACSPPASRFTPHVLCPLPLCRLTPHAYRLTSPVICQLPSASCQLLPKVPNARHRPCGSGYALARRKRVCYSYFRAFAGLES